METITYKENTYPLRFHKNGVISTIELSNALEADNFEGEAENIDNYIYLYVSAEEINLEEKEFNKLIKQL